MLAYAFGLTAIRASGSWKSAKLKANQHPRFFVH
jgi:hypothetical protein